MYVGMFKHLTSKWVYVHTVPRAFTWANKQTKWTVQNEIQPLKLLKLITEASHPY